MRASGNPDDTDELGQDETPHTVDKAAQGLYKNTIPSFLFKKRKEYSACFWRCRCSCSTVLLTKEKKHYQTSGNISWVSDAQKIISLGSTKLLNYVDSCLTFGKNWINLCCIEASFGYSLEVKTAMSRLSNSIQKIQYIITHFSRWGFIWTKWSD